MKKSVLAILIISIFLLSAHIFISQVYAQDLKSNGGYEILDPSINSGGDDDQTSTSGDYNLFETIGGDLNDIRFESANYKLGSGQAYVFMAHVPIIDYFQTDDSAMEQVCGEGGCYDRARFEIDTQNNPDDALYLIEISTDNWTTVMYVDGPTRNVVTTKSIADYLTVDQWEGVEAGYEQWDGANVIGLTPDTEYKIRARALNGDFTESSPGPDMTETTTLPTLTFDINIAGDTWASSTAPYEIDLGEITYFAPPAPPTTASDFIWLDLGTNAVSGAIVTVRDLNEGLQHVTASDIIDSEDEDLASETEGYGLKIDISKRLPATGSPGYFRESSTYNTSSQHEVGGLLNSPLTILCTIEEVAGSCPGTGAPLVGGRSGIWVKARAADYRSTGGYYDEITFTAVGTF